MSQTKVICFANNKGGSGKSTTCSNVGYALASLGKRVLLVDGDMQLNLSLSFFDEETVLSMAQGEKNLYYAIKEEKDLADYIIPTPYENLDIIPSSTLMSGIEVELFTKWQREFILRKCLERVRATGKYDFILVDAPPTLGGWVMNIMCASDYVVVPVEASPWGLVGLANMFEFTEKVRSMSPTLSVLGIAVTKADERKNYFHQTLETLGSIEGVTLFQNIIRVDSTVEWSQDNSKPVLAYKPSARSAKEYLELTKEILEYVSRKSQH